MMKVELRDSWRANPYAADDLALAAGDKVTVIFKASDMRVGK
jgi:molybdopterin-binding protein